ncbi:catalase family peroxidase [Aliidiomarina celeris]|uniref:catalase family peroxidase n=1 Tax=Aliidiomarina celeris TaxID=2249428 RepID=UPI000DEAC6AF|nr:catalase family peroxidase [Aliidiomarina celeris]
MRAPLSKYIALAGVAAAISGVFLYAGGFFGNSQLTAQEFVNLQQGANPHAGFRRAHAKGFCVAGEVRSNGALAEHSVAAVLQSTTTPFIGRFSTGGNNPLAPDLSSPVRSLALSFSESPEQNWRIAMNTPPVMAVATPEAFYAQLSALSPDPATGQRDPSRIQAFFQQHPESQTFRNWSASYQATGSLAAEQYHSINAFYLVNSAGERQAVRWAAVPKTQVASNPFAEQNDALRLELEAQLAQAPVAFDWQFTFAGANDDENNPTQLWPESNEQKIAGQIVITRIEPDSACSEILYDPLILPAGVQATADPILRARSAAYAESYRRRAREVAAQHAQ